MIVSRTPLRISLAGGGSDIPAWYREHGGAVLSSAIDKYVFVAVRRRFDDQVRAGYTLTEIVPSREALQHELMREAMLSAGVERGIEIVTIADVPAQGTGLGSSSSVTVGLLHALYRYAGIEATAEEIAREACAIEIERLGKPIGKQDQYIAAYGGLRVTRFHRDGAVTTTPVAITAEAYARLDRSLMLFYTGITRSASTVLGDTAFGSEANAEYLGRIVALVQETADALGRGDVDAVGAILHEGWELKHSLGDGISSPEIDALYAAARAAGATGGKIAGAGGGGFLLLAVPEAAQARVRAAMGARLRELPFHLVPHGSEIVLDLPYEEAEAHA
ncbi:MAG: GHMP kinase [Dehalococcoidia bacterium]